MHGPGELLRAPSPHGTGGRLRCSCRVCTGSQGGSEAGTKRSGSLIESHAGSASLVKLCKAERARELLNHNHLLPPGTSMGMLLLLFMILHVTSCSCGGPSPSLAAVRVLHLPCQPRLGWVCPSAAGFGGERQAPCLHLPGPGVAWGPQPEPRGQLAPTQAPTTPGEAHFPRAGTGGGLGEQCQPCWGEGWCPANRGAGGWWSSGAVLGCT